MGHQRHPSRTPAETSADGFPRPGADQPGFKGPAAHAVRTLLTSRHCHMSTSSDEAMTILVDDNTP